jgi:exodeoxyribonuclease VII small subunit
MDELDALVERLESGQVPVDELLQGHQRAQALLTFCRDRLQAVESALLVETGGADGTAKTRPLEPADLRPAAGAGA